jgi:hypothetical protein
MNTEIGAEAALFPEKEYIKGIFVAVHADSERFREVRQSSLLCLHSVKLFLKQLLNLPRQLLILSPSVSVYAP